MSGEGLPAGAGVGGAIAQDGEASPAGASTQSEPMMDVDVVSEQDRIDGILAQTRVDVGTEDAARITEVLEQRFADAGITASAEQVTAFAEGLAAE